jgi:methionyl aminopeptidase
MKLIQNSQFASASLVKLKGQDWLDKQRIAGKIVAKTLTMLQDEVANKTQLTLSELNEKAEKLITDAGAIPTFKNYKGTFPAGVCISVNEQLVHGVPTNTRLVEGDVVSFDLGATYEGAIADSALTCIYGKPKSEMHVKIIKATEDSLMKGIQAIAIGKNLGCIGYAISRCAKGHGFNVINNYGGHGLDWNSPHANPFVPNKSELNEGIHIVPGLTIAIEPMLVPGSVETKVADDGWTVMTNGIGAHSEHSVFVHEDHVEIITDRSKL